MLCFKTSPQAALRTQTQGLYLFYIFIYFFNLGAPQCVWDLNSLTRDSTCSAFIGGVES